MNRFNLLYNISFYILCLTFISQMNIKIFLVMLNPMVKYKSKPMNVTNNSLLYFFYFQFVYPQPDWKIHYWHMQMDSIQCTLNIWNVYIMPYIIINQQYINISRYLI